MGFKCGIVGLPNVGKSTLFNALTNTAAAAADNYPFCTIDPNIGRVPVPDPRLEEIFKYSKAKEKIETRLDFVDIAGLVRGASRGEGLGNQFLGNIRQVDAIIHVLRCFEDDDVAHVEGRIDPVADAGTVETELMIADLERIEGRLERANKKVRSGDKDAGRRVAMLESLKELLGEGRPAREFKPDDSETGEIFRELQLLSAKPVLYVSNVDEASAETGNKYTQAVAEMAREKGAAHVIISAAVEAEIAQLEAIDDRKEFLLSLGLEEAGLDRVIRAGYELLDHITFYTTGPKEARAWSVKRGTKAPAAAGLIHTDFERGFIRAEKITCEDYIACRGELGAKEAGKMSLEGRDYVIQDGDILYFRFAV